MFSVSGALPRKRLAGFYFFWFASLGALLPYWSLYLENAGYPPSRIGAMFAILMGTKMVAPNVWGWIADHHGHRTAIIRAAAALAALLFLGMPFAGSYAALALLMAGYGFFANASLPQFEAVTFNHLGRREQEYGRIRLWGSVGFILSVTALGFLIDRTGTGLVPWWVLVCLIGLSLMSLTVFDPGNAAHDEHSDGLWQVLRRPEVASLLVVCFLVQFSHGPYYSFFSIYMQESGYSGGAIGLLWAVGVVAEIVVFACLPWLAARISLRRLLLVALALTALRWLLLAAYPRHVLLVTAAQLLHLASFGLCHAVAVSLIHRMFRGRLQGRGQALYSSLSFGAGGALGSLISGYLWEAAPPSASFLMAAGAACLGWFIAWRGLHGAPAAGPQALAPGSQ